MYNYTTIAYCNLHRMRVAHDLFKRIGEDIGAQIVCCSEPNIEMTKERKEWLSDDKMDVAQWTTGPAMERNGRGNGFVWAEYKDLVLYTCYISPNTTEVEFANFLEGLGKSMKAHNGNAVVVGDFNAWGTLWGSKKTNNRGDLVLDWMEKWGMCILNDGICPTFVNGTQESFIDLTFCTRDMANRIQYWRVLEEKECGSDHLPIAFGIRTNIATELGEAPRMRRFKECHREPFFEHIRESMSSVETPAALMTVIENGCRDVIGFHKARHRKTPNIWWNQEIATIRKECISTRRKLTRMNRRGAVSQEEKEELGKTHITLSKNLRDAIKRAKGTIWKEQVERLNADPWGVAYRIASGKTRRAQRVDLETQYRVAEELFPVHGKALYENLPEGDPPDPFSSEELWNAVGRLKTGKAPGPDGVAPEVTRAVCLKFPETCLTVFNGCLLSGEFPGPWKTANLIAIPKPKKNRSDRQTYRPICLINTTAKILEHLIQRRLRTEVESKLSERQFGYRTGKSTVDALRKVFEFGRNAKSEGKFAVLVALDVRNAFNSAPWGKIDEALGRLGVSPYLRALTRSYFSDRKIVVGDRVIEVTSGVPQGSVLGPLLWCILYNDVLEMDLGSDTELSCYADDLAIMVTGKTRQKATGRAGRIADEVIDKLQSLGLTVAAEKTEVVMLRSKRKKAPLSVLVKGQKVYTAESIKYLGVWLSRDLHLGKHLKETADRADTAALAITGLMPNRGGPSQAIRMMFAKGIQGILLYAAPAWFDGMSAKTQIGDLERAARRVTLRVCRGHKGISYEASQVIAGIPPAYLLAKERTVVANGMERRTAREELRREWAARWRECRKAEWTRRLVPDLDRWLSRKHGQVGYAVCQMLSGIGVFRDHLAMIGRSSSSACVFCYEKDTAEHAIFECRRFCWWRRQVELNTGAPLRPDTVVDTMCRGQAEWRAVEDYTERVVRMKEGEAQKL